MAKKSMIVKANKKQKFKVREYTRCERCGRPICTGRYCDGCKANMANNLKNAFEKPQPQVAPKKQAKDQRMRFVQTDQRLESGTDVMVIIASVFFALFDGENCVCYNIGECIFMP